jgi:glycosyltransferase involved in cell wall biosynthesis
MFEVSVIIPVYNAAPFVEKAIRSALPFPCVKEIVIVDDGSTDDSRIICREIEEGEKRVKLIQHQDRLNHGAAASFNLGIVKSKCQFIAILGADDYFLENRFDAESAIFHDKSIDGIYGGLGAELLDFDYDAQERAKRAANRLTTMNEIIPPELLFENMAPIGKKGYFSGCALTVRRELYDKVGLFDEYLELSQDTQMWMKMALIGRLVPGIIDQPIAMRGVHAGNRIKNKERMLELRPYLFLSLIEWCKSHNIPQHRIDKLWDKYLSFNYILISKKIGNPLLKWFALSSMMVKCYYINPRLLFRSKFPFSF